MTTIIEIAAADFNRKVLQSPFPVMVDFFSDHCGPCRLLEPILEDVVSELNGKMAVYMLNVLDNADLVDQLGIAALPTVSVFDRGTEVARLVGLQNKERLLEAVQSVAWPMNPSP